MGNVKSVKVRWVEGKEFVTETESGHRVTTDAGLAAGGSNHGPSPMELILGCLGGCTGISFVDILRKKRQALSGVEIDVTGAIGETETYPKTYSSIEVVYTVRGRAISRAAVEEAFRLSREKYCGISEMLAKSADLVMRFEIVEDSGVQKTEIA